MTAIAFGCPSAVRRVPSSGSTATSTAGPWPSPTSSPLKSIGASSFSPSPMTTTPFIDTVDTSRRMALTAAASAPFLSPRPTQRPAAMAAASVTRTSSSARLRSGRSPPTCSDPGTLESDIVVVLLRVRRCVWRIVATSASKQNDRHLCRLHARPHLVVLPQPQVCDRLGGHLGDDGRLAVALDPDPGSGVDQLPDDDGPGVAGATARPVTGQADRMGRYDAQRCSVTRVGRLRQGQRAPALDEQRRRRDLA